MVERTRRADIVRRADAARLDRGAAALVNLDRRDAFGREIGEVERARRRRIVPAADVRGRDLAAVDRHQVEFGAEAANGHQRAFAILAIDRHAGMAEGSEEEKSELQSLMRSSYDVFC